MRRFAPAGMVFHVVNRGVRKLRLFDHDGDYQAWISTLAEAQDRIPLALFAYCLMPNHFHLIVQPSTDRQMSLFMQWFTATQSKRWHAFRNSVGTGAVYQSRFKASPVQTDGHFIAACRYVERNALTAKLVARAEDWPWSSLAQRLNNCNTPVLSPWPILQPPDWTSLVNAANLQQEVLRIRLAIRREAPYGGPDWVAELARDLRV